MTKFTGDSSLWNMSKPTLIILKKFMIDEIERVKQDNKTDDTPLAIENIDEEDFKFLNSFHDLFHHFVDSYLEDFKPDIFTKNMDWSTRAVGNFFIKNLINFKDGCEAGKDFNSKLHQLFTLPKQHLSLPYIASLYSVNDYRALAIDKDFDVEFHGLMKSCIEEVANDAFGNHNTDLFFKEEVNPWNYIEPSPCLANNTSYKSCNNYCKWHNTYFKELNKTDFITLMKYAIPQRKLSLSLTQAEQELAKKIFGNNFSGNMNHMFAPFSLMLFCYKKNNGFMGDNIGMFAKVCNEFFPTPTDQGICLTQNMDIKEMMKTNKEYESLFEPKEQKRPESVKDGTFGSKHTLAFFSGTGTDSFDDSAINTIDQIDARDMKKEGEVRLKFHQANQIPDLLENNRLQNYFSTPSLTLKNGYEYEIKVIPKVIETTSAFKKMNLDQRKCKLSHEVEENSIFKIYTQQNCKYECYIKKAESFCNCIPWDFMHQNAMAKECDIFGRTCFYNAMENISKSRNVCDDCVKECDYITYDGVVIRETKSNLFEIKRSFRRSKYCEGEKFFCDYFWPQNGTNIIDKGLENSFNSMIQYNDFKEKHVYMAKDLVIVHWRILEPEIKVIDAKYTINDKFANFGGNFGIFAEITGCSFLGIVNFLILLFKLIFSARRQNQE